MPMPYRKKQEEKAESVCRMSNAEIGRNNLPTRIKAEKQAQKNEAEKKKKKQKVGGA
jgi:hypothetical protein